MQGIVVQHKLNIASPGSNAPVATGKSTAACKSRLFTLDAVLLPADIQLPDEVGSHLMALVLMRSCAAGQKAVSHSIC